MTIANALSDRKQNSRLRARQRGAYAQVNMRHLSKAIKDVWNAMHFNHNELSTLEIQKIKSEVERLASTISAPTDLLPTFGPSSLEEVPFLLHDAEGYHLAYRERGQVSKKTYTSEDDLLFAVFESITQSMALDAVPAESYKDDSRDSRRLWFPQKVELMRRLSAAWGEREVQRQGEVLRKHPFDDAAISRAHLSKDFRDQGYGNDTAWAMACERYPLPDSASS